MGRCRCGPLVAIPPPPADSSSFRSGAIPPPPPDSSSFQGPQSISTAPPDADFEVKTTDGFPGSKTPAYIAALPNQSGQYQEAASPLIPSGVSSFLSNSVGANSDILSNRQTGILGAIAQTAPATVAAIAGATAAAPYGAPFGPAGMFAAGVGGALLGGMSGEAARQGAVQINNISSGNQLTPPQEVLDRVRDAGIIQAAGEGATRLGGAILRMPAGTGNTIGGEIADQGGKLIKIATNVDSRSGAFMLGHPQQFADAPTLAEAGEKFGAYMKSNGFVNQAEGAKQYLGTIAPTKANILDFADGAVKDAELYSSGAQGTHPDVNKLLVAREQLQDLSETPAMRNELSKTKLGYVYKQIGVLDDAIEALNPGYHDIRKGYQAASVADQFSPSSIVPMNKHGQPNGLLPYLAIAGTGGVSQLIHNPLALAAAPLFSPAAYGLAVKGAVALSNTGLARGIATGLGAHYLSPAPDNGQAGQ